LVYGHSTIVRFRATGITGFLVLLPSSRHAFPFFPPDERLILLENMSLRKGKNVLKKEVTSPGPGTPRERRCPINPPGIFGICF